MKYIDCNESSWQTELVVNGERGRYSNRTAVNRLRNEMSAEEAGNHQRAEMFRRSRQTGEAAKS